MAPGQDWCLQCGSGAPGSVSSGSWRPAAAIAAATLLLVLAAAGAGYAALSHNRPKAVVVTRTVAQATPPAATPGATSAPTTGVAPPTTTVPGAIVKPPKIPLKAVTPAPAVTAPATVPTTTTKAAEGTTGAGTQTTSTTGAGGEPKQEAIVLDTDAATTYNPYSYPASTFGDPSLAIDGDTSTGWTAQVNPASAPAMAEGVVLDLDTPQKLSAVKLVTTTPGMTVQVYGANGKTLPASITAPAWVPLSRSIVIKKRQARIGLRNQKKAYRFLVLWISKAPASPVGTPQAPARVTVNELEVFPAS